MSKCLFLINLIILNTLLFGELISVPGFNYSINTVEGWVIQPYNDDSNLRWLSEDSRVALKVQSWKGSEFENINLIAQEVDKSVNLQGDLYEYKYLGLESAIGEVTFKVNGLIHKGWVLLINGLEFDYYLISYSLIEHYEDNVSEMQSALDSFSYSNNGIYNPGPVTSFLDVSSQKVYKKYEIDFLGQKIQVTASEYDFGTAQSVIEREANIMLNYSFDPNNFYNAWKRYYKLIFRDSFHRLDIIYNEVSKYLPETKYSNYEKAEILMFWIQSFSYERNQESTSDLLNPLQASVSKIGDCDARSLVFSILLKKFGINSLLLTSEIYKHAIVGIDCPGEGSFYEYKGKKYLMVELTTKALIGEVDKKFEDLSKWTPVEMEYTNGF